MELSLGWTGHVSIWERKGPIRQKPQDRNELNWMSLVCPRVRKKSVAGPQSRRVRWQVSSEKEAGPDYPETSWLLQRLAAQSQCRSTALSGFSQWCDQTDLRCFSMYYITLWSDEAAAFKCVIHLSRFQSATKFFIPPRNLIGIFFRFLPEDFYSTPPSRDAGTTVQTVINLIPLLGSFWSSDS